MTLTRFTVPLLVGLALSAPGARPIVAQVGEVPADLQHGLMLRTLTFDRKISRMGPEVVVAVLHQPAHGASRQAARAFAEAAAASGIRSVEGLPIRIVEVAWHASADPLERLHDIEADVVYLAPVRGVDVRAFARAASDAGMLTVTGVPDYMELGVALGLARRDDRARIMVDLDAVRRAGSAFAAQLLRLAEILQ